MGDGPVISTNFYKNFDNNFCRKFIQLWNKQLSAYNFRQLLYTFICWYQLCAGINNCFTDKSSDEIFKLFKEEFTE